MYSRVIFLNISSTLAEAQLVSFGRVVIWVSYWKMKSAGLMMPPEDSRMFQYSEGVDELKSWTESCLILSM